MADFHMVRLTSNHIQFYINSILSTKHESNKGILTPKTYIIVSD